MVAGAAERLPRRRGHPVLTRRSTDGPRRIGNSVRRLGLALFLASLIGAIALVAALDGRAFHEDASTAASQVTADGTPTPADAGSAVFECVPDQVLARFRPGVDPAAVSARHGATFTGAIVGLDVHVLTVPSGTVMEKVAALSADPDVVYAEPNGIARIAEAPSAAAQPCGATPSPGG